MMRDRLVCGINEERWQKRLLAEPNLTYKKAIDIAQALETAEKNVKDISNGKDMPPPRIHHVGYKEREEVKFTNQVLVGRRSQAPPALIHATVAMEATKPLNVASKKQPVTIVVS